MEPDQAAVSSSAIAVGGLISGFGQGLRFLTGFRKRFRDLLHSLASAGHGTGPAIFAIGPTLVVENPDFQDGVRLCSGSAPSTVKA